MAIGALRLVRRLAGVIEITERARELLGKAEAAAHRFDPAVTIRIVGEPHAVRFELADGPASGDEEVRSRELTIYVEPHLSGVVDVEDPHDRLVLRPHPVDA